MSRIALSQYKIENLNWNAYVDKISKLVNKAKEQNAQILLLPEYSGLEVAGHHETDHELFKTIQTYIPAYLELFKNLSKKYQIYIQPGTILVEAKPDLYLNRAYFFSPSGTFAFQDKLELTAFEKQSQLIAPGKEQVLFDTKHGKIGIAICYDSEFPEIVRRLTFAGARLILVPSYTTSIAGYNRVRISCRARALENQCYVATSFMVGHVELSLPVEETFGQTALFGPVDKNFPNDGIICETKFNQPELITTEFSLDKLKQVHEQGDVHNLVDAINLQQNNYKINFINLI